MNREEILQDLLDALGNLGSGEAVLLENVLSLAGLAELILDADLLELAADLAHEDVGHGVAQAADDTVLFDGDHAAALLGIVQDTLSVNGLDGVDVDDGHALALGLQKLGSLQSGADHQASSKYCHIRAVPHDVGLADLEGIILLKDRGSQTGQTQIHRALLDGLLVPGGEDICPSFYGQSPVPQVVYTYADKDRMDLALVRMAAEAGLPVFGICRGLQIINVCFGGTLIQDLPSQRPGSLVHTSDKDTLRTHEARLVPGSLMERLLGNEPLMVNTYHHQAVDVLAPGFSITAFAEDGVVEAIEDNVRNIYAVQWHPERLVEAYPRFRPLFRYLVEQAVIWRTAHRY